MRSEQDLFLNYLKTGNDEWHTRALTDRSHDYSIPEDQTNHTLATYGDAVLKLALCEILLDRVEELTEEKKKYESDVALIRVAKYYGLLDYLRFDRRNPQIPKDYHTQILNPSFSHSKKERVRKFNRRHKYIATAIEAVLGAMYRSHRDFGEIVEVVRTWMRILDSDERSDAN